MSSRNGPDVPKLMLTVISRSVNLPWTASGFVCSMSISLSFPAPSSSIDLNSNNDKTYKVTPMIKLLGNASIEQRKKPSWFATISEFLGVEARYTKYSRKGQCKEKWNHFWDNRFSVLNPRAFPPPGDRFSAQMTENRNYNWACPERGSPIIKIVFRQNVIKAWSTARHFNYRENRRQDHHKPHLHTMKVYIASPSNFFLLFFNHWSIHLF